MTEQVTDRDSIVRGSRFTIAWETSSDNAVYVTMTLLLIQDLIQENEWTATCKLRIETALSEEVASLLPGRLRRTMLSMSWAEGTESIPWVSDTIKLLSNTVCSIYCHHSFTGDSRQNRLCY